MIQGFVEEFTEWDLLIEKKKNVDVKDIGNLRPWLSIAPVIINIFS